MPRQRLIVRNVALLLLFASGMTMIAGASSTPQQQVAGADDSLPQDTIVIDAIGDLPTSTRFNQNLGCWGASLDEHSSVGPEFTLTKATTITDIGAYVESCWVTRRECQPIPAIVVNIHPRLKGKPDLATVIASYTLSNDNDRTLISYESVKVELTLQPGTYYAIFNNPSNDGLLLSGTFGPNKYKCRSVTQAEVLTDPDSVNISKQYLAVRILKKPD